MRVLGGTGYSTNNQPFPAETEAPEEQLIPDQICVAANLQQTPPNLQWYKTKETPVTKY